MLSECPKDSRDAHESSEHVGAVKFLEQYQPAFEVKDDEFHEDSDSDGRHGLDFSNDEQTLQKDLRGKISDDSSDEENNDVAQELPHVVEQIDFHEGRMRRKAIFSNDADAADLKVILLSELLVGFLLPSPLSISHGH